jgi:N-acetylmuramoyl-L-alanine amidase
MKKKVVILAGHSKSDSGAKTPHYTEYQFVNLLAKSIAPLITDIEAISFDRDTYAKLPSQINATNADYCIEFHLNAFDQLRRGHKVLYCQNSVKGKALAEHINKCLTASNYTIDKGITELKKGDRGYTLVSQTTMPTVIVELAFIDNETDIDMFMKNFLIIANNMVLTINRLNNL